MSDATRWIRAIRASHERLAALVEPLSEEQVTAPSYASEWTIADVASHLGSQGEIFGLFLEAGLSGTAAPGGEVFGPIWDRWNSLSPTEQVANSVATNSEFVTRLEQVPEADRDRFALSMFGLDLDLAGLAMMRLGEHAVHTWDIAVALDPTATLAADAVELLIDTVGQTAARSGKPVDGAAPVAVTTTSPERHYRVELHPDVALVASSGAGDVTLPAEAFIRLVYGRLDADHTPGDVTGGEHLAPLRAAFPGF